MLSRMYKNELHQIITILDDKGFDITDSNIILLSRILKDQYKLIGELTVTNRYGNNKYYQYEREIKALLSDNIIAYAKTNNNGKYKLNYKNKYAKYYDRHDAIIRVLNSSEEKKQLFARSIDVITDNKLIDIDLEADSDLLAKHAKEAITNDGLKRLGFNNRESMEAILIRTHQLMRSQLRMSHV